MEKLEWYVINYDFNRKEMEDFNIFRSVRFTEGVENLLKENLSFDEFVERLEKELMYAFWSKVEYEVMIGDVFGTIERKVDIYSQVKPNVRLLAKYILDNYNE